MSKEQNAAMIGKIAVGVGTALTLYNIGDLQKEIEYTPGVKEYLRLQEQAREQVPVPIEAFKDTERMSDLTDRMSDQYKRIQTNLSEFNTVQMQNEIYLVDRLNADIQKNNSDSLIFSALGATILIAGAFEWYNNRNARNQTQSAEANK